MFPISPHTPSSFRRCSNGAPTSAAYARGKHHYGCDPELDGATGPAVFGGRSDGTEAPCTGCELNCTFPTSRARDMHSCLERAETLCSRIEKLIELRRTERAKRKIGVVLFNFPPNAGNVGTAASLAVFPSLYNVLLRLKEEGYTVEVPASLDEMRERILGGNASRYGTSAMFIPASRSMTTCGASAGCRRSRSNGARRLVRRKAMAPLCSFSASNSATSLSASTCFRL